MRKLFSRTHINEAEFLFHRTIPVQPMKFAVMIIPTDVIIIASHCKKKNFVFESYVSTNWNNKSKFKRKTSLYLNWSIRGTPFWWREIYKLVSWRLWTQGAGSAWYFGWCRKSFTLAHFHCTFSGSFVKETRAPNVAQLFETFSADVQVWESPSSTFFIRRSIFETLKSAQKLQI